MANPSFEMTVTVHKTNTNPIVLTDVVHIEMGNMALLVTQARNDALGDWESTVTIRRHVITAVNIAMVQP